MSDDQFAIARWKKVGRQGLDKTHAARAENNVVPRHAIQGAPPPKVLFNFSPPNTTFKNFVLDTYDSAIRTGIVHRARKDQVFAIEGLLTASPEFFRPDAPGAAGTYTDESVRILVERGMAFLKEKHGEHLIRVELQLDEVTPHLQFAFFPIDSRGKWSAKNCMKRGHLLALWDGWADAMRDFGLKRGLKGSAGRHEPIKVYYDAINRFETDDVDVEALITLSPPVISPPSKLGLQHPEKYVERINNLLVDWAKKEMVRIQNALRPIIAAASSTGLANRRSATDRKTTARTLEKMVVLEREVTDLRAKALTPVTVAAVRDKLGYGGALEPKLQLDTIAYLDQVEGLDLDQALGWLSGTFGAPAAAATLAEIFRSDTLARAAALPSPRLRSLAEIKEALEAQLSSLRVDSVRIFLHDRAAISGKGRLLKLKGRKTNEWSTEDVVRMLPELKAKSARQEIRIETVSATYDYVLVRGMTTAGALESFACLPCCVVQVAPDRFDAVLRIPAETETDDKVAFLGELRNGLDCAVEDVSASNTLPMAGFLSGERADGAIGNSLSQFRVELVAANDVDFMKRPETQPGFSRPEFG